MRNKQGKLEVIYREINNFNNEISEVKATVYGKQLQESSKEKEKVVKRNKKYYKN